MAFDPMLIVYAGLLVLTGAVAGIMAGLLGVGGGIVIVPVLFLLSDALNISPDIAMHLAVGTSLATIIPTSISSARSHNRKGAIDWDLLRGWAPFVFVGAGIGGLLAKVFSSLVLTGIFGCVALIVALNMIKPKQIIVAQQPPTSVAGRGVLATLIGGFSALMGIGGGTLSVPILTLFSFPVHRAVGTASAFGLVIAVPAVLGFIWAGWGVEGRPPWSLGYVSLPAAVLIFSTSIFAAPQGARLAHWLSPAKLRFAFAVFLGLTALRMLSAVFSGG
ncbi:MULTISPECIES: sulfite exporter TauE/SafE family protein [unclassified Meridianimarinicoccus]|uniref:sulfite exporter TauE/SafE family protein n=1 Tax=unclassified Meridianimarinicoccus TaxID=2923344 RepID=UPI001D00D597|nr:sulfite exporter TauE/SafE family protein [Fluviibacterium sp. MJW13]